MEGREVVLRVPPWGALHLQLRKALEATFCQYYLYTKVTCMIIQLSFNRRHYTVFDDYKWRT